MLFEFVGIFLAALADGDLGRASLHRARHHEAGPSLCRSRWRHRWHQIKPASDFVRGSSALSGLSADEFLREGRIQLWLGQCMYGERPAGTSKLDSLIAIRLMLVCVSPLANSKESLED